MTDSLCTVEAAAERLKLHPKTVLRYIREGRLKATRVGKAYRIPRSEIDALAGLPAPPAAASQASVTSIVDIPDMASDLAAKWARSVSNALYSKPKDGPLFRADVVYDPQQRHLKIIMVGSPGDSANLLGLIRFWLEQLTV